MQVQLRMFGDVVLDEFGPVGRGPIPDDKQRPRKMSAELPQEGDDIGTFDVVVVGQQMEIEVDAMALGTEGEGTDGGDAVVPLGGAMLGRVPPWGKGAPTRGRKLEPGFVEEDRVSAETSSLFFLSAEPSCETTARWRLRRVGWRDIRVVGCSN